METDNDYPMDLVVQQYGHWYFFHPKKVDSSMNAILRFFLHQEQWNARAAGLFLVAIWQGD